MFRCIFFPLGSLGALLIAAVLFYVLFLSGMNSVSAEPEGTARYYPDDALAYVWVTLSPERGQLEDAKMIWRMLHDGGDFRGALDDFQNDFEERTGIHPERDLMPWIGPQLSLGVLDFPGDIADFDGPAAVAMAQVRDRDAAAEFLNARMSYLSAENGLEFESVDYRGYELWLSGETSRYYVLTDDWLLLASGRGLLESALDRLDGTSDEAVLSEHPNFVAARAKLPGRRFASAYMDVDRMLEETNLSVFWHVGGVRPPWSAFSARLEDGAIVGELLAPGGIEPPLEVADLSAPAELLPADTMGFAALAFDPDLDDMRELLSRHALPALVLGSAGGLVGGPAPDSEFSTYADMLDVALGYGALYLGVDLEEGFFDWLSGELIVVLQPYDFPEEGADAEPFELALGLSYRDGSEDALLDTLGAVEERLGLDGEPLDAAGDDGVARVYDLSGFLGGADDGGYAPGYTISDAYLFFGSTVDSLAELVEARQGVGALLSDDAEYLRVAEHLPERSQFLTYVDVNRLLRGMDADRLGVSEERYALLLESVGSLGLSWYAPHCLGLADDGGICELRDDDRFLRYRAVLTLFAK